MKIYVAGSSRELERAESVITACRALGHEITVDWPASMRASKADHELSPAEQEHYARLDIRGVLEADLVWLLIPSRANPSAGAWFEAGVAHTAAMFSQRPRRTIASGVVGGYIFARVLDAVYETDAAALLHVDPFGDPGKLDALARCLSRVNDRPWEFTTERAGPELVGELAKQFVRGAVTPAGTPPYEKHAPTCGYIGAPDDPQRSCTCTGGWRG